MDSMDSFLPHACGHSPSFQQEVVAQKANITNVGRDNVDASVSNVINVESSLSVTNVTNNAVAMSELRPYLLELEKYISRGAAHDSFERGGLDAPKCHPKTRKALQESIMGWIGGDGGEEHEAQIGQDGGDGNEARTAILWLSGPAGSGKTAIAGSVADSCQRKGWLAGTFFFSAFSGRQDRRSKLYVIPTLAYHLIHQKSIPGLREKILSAIGDNPSVFDKRLREQFEILILQPLRSIPADVDRTLWPKVIIIDGLDECGAALGRAIEDAPPDRDIQEANQKELVTDVLAHAFEDPAFPFRVLITSRPEPAISQAFSTFRARIVPLFLDDKYNPAADITIFLCAKFAEIRCRFNISGDWPCKEDINILVENASGQFIYASTVARFVANQDGATGPQARLKRVIEWKARGDAQPLSVLESLYANIIATSPDPPLANKWLLTIHKLRNHVSPILSGFKGEFVKKLLETSPGQTYVLLGNLCSLVNLGSEGHGNLPLFSFYHKSLGDFLESGVRCAELYPEQVQTVRMQGGPRITFPERVVTNFVVERLYATLETVRQRGHSSVPQPNDGHETPHFLEQFCVLLSGTVLPQHEYEAADVDWWWSCISRGRPGSVVCNLHNEAIGLMFSRIHKDCRWFTCRPSCKVWRQGIRTHVPSLFLDPAQEKAKYSERFLGFGPEVDFGSLRKRSHGTNLFRLRQIALAQGRPLPKPEK